MLAHLSHLKQRIHLMDFVSIYSILYYSIICNILFFFFLSHIKFLQLRVSHRAHYIFINIFTNCVYRLAIFLIYFSMFTQHFVFFYSSSHVVFLKQMSNKSFHSQLTKTNPSFAPMSLGNLEKRATKNTTLI